MAAVLLGSLFVLLALNVPIAFSVGLASIVTVWLKMPVPTMMIAQKMYAGVNSFPLMAIPLYVLAGLLMQEGKIMVRLVRFAKSLIGFVRGGIGMASVMAAMFFAGVSGSSIADTAAVGSLLIPEMKKDGYGESFPTALVASAGTIGGIIPPSIAMILYGVVAEVSIAKLFLGGAVPGVLIGLSFMGICFFYSRKHNLPKGEKPRIKEILVSFLHSLLPLGLPIVIVGGILTGVFTATEAGVIAVFYSLILSMMIYRTIRVQDLPKMILKAAMISAVPVLVIATASFFAYLMAIAEVPQILYHAVKSLSDNPYIILLVINVGILIIGTFMEAAPVYPILVPILLPIVTAMGMSPIHFGVVMMVALSIGLITPPVGVCLFTACSVAEVPISRVIGKLVPFIIAETGVLFLITYFPPLVMTLANVVGK
ncbi:MAG TPA: TRAP transporter large permease [Spirochaetia bacterium]|nr:TRAP transporter large permease [Spirochaetia bacterium]